MLFRTFSAATMAEAMAAVRAALGPDAVIVSTRAAKAGAVEIVAAAEPSSDRVAEPDDAVAPEPVLDFRLARDPARRVHAATPASPPRPDVAAALDFHGVPGALAADLARLADSLGEDDPVAGLAAALEARFRFAPLAAAPRRPVLLVGPPGAGKTVCAAKLASHAALADQPVALFTTDSVRAGGMAQLGHFAGLLDCPVVAVEDAAALPGHLAAAEGRVRIVDTTGGNPLDAGDLAGLRRLARCAEFEVALVLPAGGDPREAAEIAEAFAQVGARRLIATRLDATRRLGSLLAAADAGLAFSQVGISPYVARGLCRLDPLPLARLLLEDPAERPSFDLLHEAAE